MLDANRFNYTNIVFTAKKGAAIFSTSFAVLVSFRTLSMILICVDLIF